MPRGSKMAGMAVLAIEATMDAASTSGESSSSHPPTQRIPSTRSTSTRSAKSRANAYILDHDKEIDALIRKHDKKGARGFAKIRKPKKATATEEVQDQENDDTTRTPSGSTTTTAAQAQNASLIDGDSDDDFDRIDDTMVRANVSAKRAAPKALETRTTQRGAAAAKKTTAMTTAALTTGKGVATGIKTATDQARLVAKPATIDAKRVTKAKPVPKVTKKVYDRDTIMTDVMHIPLSPATPKRGVLGESTRRNNVAIVPSEPSPSTVDQGEPAKADHVDPAKGSPVRRHLLSPAKTRLQLHSPLRSKSTSPSKPRSRTMPEGQILSFLENYDLEAENKVRNALRTLRMSVESSNTQMHARVIAKLPRSIRLMRLGDFVHEYGADVQAALQRTAVIAKEAREGAWQEDQLQRKRKEDREMEEGMTRSKSARLLAEGDDTGNAAVAAKAATAKKHKGQEASRSANRSSPIRPPTSATFSPRLPLLATPAKAPRKPRTGEAVVVFSTSGSPLDASAIVLADGRVLTLQAGHGKGRIGRRATQDGGESDIGGDSVFEEAQSHVGGDEEEESLPDEEAYTAQVLREEAQKRAMARSSASSRFYGAGRSSHSTIRATTMGRSSTSVPSSNGVMPSSPIVRSR